MSENSKLTIKDSPIEGKGAFADQNISKGETILIIDDSHIIAKEEDAPEEEKEHLDFVNGKITIMQSPEVYINHSCDPNAYTKTINGERHLIAIRNILAGEEITYDFAINGDYEWGIACNCGSSNCRKIIHPNFWELPKERQLEYVPLLDDWFVKKYQEKVDELRQHLTR